MTIVDAFIRDDDAGWDDARLVALLDTTARAGVPIDLALIPTAVTPTLARELCGRIDAGLVAVHQHGLTHDNHELEGRKCEFGPGRDVTAQRADLQRGRALLREHFGERVQPIFTPPWNRCAAFTPALLADLGWAALSRNRGAATAQQALPEIAVDVDWSRCWREGGRAAVQREVERAHRRCGDAGQPLGLMLHHAVMSDDELRALAALLGEPGFHWRAMSRLIDAAAHCAHGAA